MGGNYFSSHHACCFIVLLPGNEKLLARFEKFATGQWTDLLRANDLCSRQLLLPGARKDCRSADLTSVSGALHVVQLGELSSGRQALEGADLAPGTIAPLNAFHGFHPTFELDEMLFSRNLRSAKKFGGWWRALLPSNWVLLLRPRHHRSNLLCPRNRGVSVWPIASKPCARQMSN